jgi:hypothetical protein
MLKMLKKMLTSLKNVEKNADQYTLKNVEKMLTSLKKC